MSVKTGWYATSGGSNYAAGDIGPFTTRKLANERARNWGMVAAWLDESGYYHDKPPMGAMHGQIVASGQRGRGPEPITFTLRDGTVALAKLYKGEPSPMTFANRTQADRAAEKMGPGWIVVRRGRPWFVVRIGGKSTNVAKCLTLRSMDEVRAYMALHK